MEMAVTVSFSLLGCFLLVARAEDFLYSSCADQIGNYTADSIYHNNLNTLLSDLTSNTEIDYGFYNFSYGQNADKVNAIGLCRGDIKPDECRTCLNDSRVFLTRFCPNQKEAISYYDKCILRYSNRSIFGLMETSPEFYMWNLNNATEVDQFNQILRNLMKSLRDTAASGDSRRKVAVANITGPSFLYLYGLVQCTPDLSTVECNGCLVGAISEISNCCNGKKGGRVIRPSCQIRFENYLFYDPAGITSPVPAPQPSPPLPSPSTNNTSSQGNRKTLRITIAIAVPVAVVLVLCVTSIYLRLRKHQRRKITEKEDAGEIKTSESLQFNFKTVRVATDDFSDSNKLGQGGFGAVYKGNLANGQAIAVKRLSRDSGQGETEFKNEVLLMAKLQHRNLVRLLGFCLEGRERLLVYEFVPNKSLDHFIFHPVRCAHLDWTTRYKIIEGIARGLLYLHEDSQQRIIHRDLKPSNILLDADMNPKISDFGLAKLFVADQSQACASKIAGTFGYMPPEYVRHGRFSVKLDVFSFGVIILEIVSGQKSTEFRNKENPEHLLSFAWENWRKGTTSNIIDPSLNDAFKNEIVRCIHIGLLCVQERVADRPTLASVVLMLDSYSVCLPVPLQPAFFMNDKFSSRHSISISGEQKSDSDKASANEASISSLYPR